MEQAQRAFYRPRLGDGAVDGPASVAFTDGTMIGAVLDRNGLRPSRYWVTDDDLVVMASEVGVIDIDLAKVVIKGRLRPGRMFSSTPPLAHRRRLRDQGHARRRTPTQRSTTGRRVRRPAGPRARRVQPRQRAAPQAAVRLHARGAQGHRRPDGSTPTNRSGRWARTPDRRAVWSGRACSTTSRSCSPRWSTRRSMRSRGGRHLGGVDGRTEANLLAPGPESCRQLALPYPIIDNDELAKILHANSDGSYPGLQAKHIKGLYPSPAAGWRERALNAICAEVSAAIEDGVRVIVLSDRNSDAVEAPIPSLLLTAAVHHHLVRTKQRTQAGLVVECGDAREVHHMALLIGYGAGAINPYLASSRSRTSSPTTTGAASMASAASIRKAVRKYIKACGKGVLKVMSKMGVSTVASYTGAQIFEAIGLGAELVDRYHRHGQPPRWHRPRRDRRRGRRQAHRGPSAAAGGAGPPQARARRRVSVAPRGRAPPVQPDDGVQAAARRGRSATRSSASTAGRSTTRASGWRRCVLIVRARATARSPSNTWTPAIMRRFATGALRLDLRRGPRDAGDRDEPHRRQVEHGEGARTPSASTTCPPLGREAGGVRPLRGHRRVPHQRRRPADQDGPGRQAGEGGQPLATRCTRGSPARYSTPGVGLISPPPHHDIYLIEDLKQLIHDLKNSNWRRGCTSSSSPRWASARSPPACPRRRPTSCSSPATTAAPGEPVDVAQARRGPWELGLAETQQTLLLNGLRDRIVVQTDGQPEDRTRRRHRRPPRRRGVRLRHRAARGVGLRMMRVCHLDTCPVRGRHPEPRSCASASPASRSSSRRSSSSSPPRRELMRRSGSARWRR